MADSKDLVKPEESLFGKVDTHNMNEPYLLYPSSTLDHHTYIFVKDFILDIPGCAECSS